MTKLRKKNKYKKPSQVIQIIQLNAKLVNQEAKYIIECAQRGDAKVITLGHQLLFFSTFEGDAWLLDTEDKLAIQLAIQGKVLPYRIMEKGSSLAIEWKADYDFNENGFAVKDKRGNMKLFPTYPVREIRDAER
jgi:hypothetical protein